MVLVTRQAPDFTAAAVLGSVRLLINSTSNSTPMVKRPFCSSGRWTSLLFARQS